jgi:hypothetical protein
MAKQRQEQQVVLRSDAPGDELKVRAILAGWGLAESEINRLLAAERPNGPHGQASFAQRRTLPAGRQPHARPA